MISAVDFFALTRRTGARPRGRHGPGNNAFAYFIGPEDIPLEFTSEVLQVDDDYTPRRPEDWQWPPGRQDQWGISDPPSARWRRIQRLTDFTAEGWHLQLAGC